MKTIKYTWQQTARNCLENKSWMNEKWACATGGVIRRDLHGGVEMLQRLPFAQTGGIGVERQHMWYKGELPPRQLVRPQSLIILSLSFQTRFAFYEEKFRITVLLIMHGIN